MSAATELLASQKGLAYQEQLGEIFPSVNIPELVNGIQTVDLPHQPGQTIDYLRTGSSNRPLILVPGFTEGVVAKLPTAAAAAEAGLDLIVIDQNHHSTPAFRQAAATQAKNNLVVLDAEDITVADLFGHSFGTPVAAEMVARDRRDWRSSHFIMAAPAGMDNSRSAFGLGKRFLTMLGSESSKKAPKEVPDSTGLMLKAGQKALLANVPRAIQEVRQLGYERVHLEALASRVGSITILGYAHDKLFTDKILAEQTQAAMELGASYAVPIDVTEIDGRLVINRYKATHNDEQFNPRRVISSVIDILRNR